ncbi:MAG: hypothetical protein ACR2L3_00915 [Actinomycetota bacterium]
MEKSRFLIANSSGADASQHLLYIWARSADEISERLPHVEIWNPAPEWMTEEMKTKVGSAHEYDIDDATDLKLLTTPPDLRFNRNNPPPGIASDIAAGRKIRRLDELAAVVKDPEVLAKAEKFLQQRPL